MGDGHDEIDSGFLGNKMGHTNVCVFTDVLVSTRGGLGTNTHERETSVFYSAHTPELFCSTVYLCYLFRLTEQETGLRGT